MAISRVIVSDNFAKLGREYERAADRALGHSAGAVVAATRAAPSEYRIESIQSKLAVTPVRRTRKGKSITVYARDFRFLFFEFGTYSRRRRKLRYNRTPKAEATAAKRGTGVKPQRAMTHAAALAREVLLQSLRQYMR